ncbi:GDSL esterase/lipase [Trifolium pratense]|uniref:GDSL esterase/lipase n=1 Tax=Trifolium pratense TaxID=57577 RepID=A0A2K3LQV1_TRIPR|nr:GDSL esterase/lipase [Trifolium pratense]
MVKGLVGIAMNSDKKSSSYDSFAALSDWIPCLFVNPSDYICSEYIGYFEHRSKMEEKYGRIEKSATQISLSCLIISAFGKESEPLHLIPSANLTVNLTPLPQSIMEAHWIEQCLEAHGIHHWWKQDLHLEPKVHRYKY